MNNDNMSDEELEFPDRSCLDRRLGGLEFMHELRRQADVLRNAGIHEPSDAVQDALVEFVLRGEPGLEAVEAPPRRFISRLSRLARWRGLDKVQHRNRRSEVMATYAAEPSTKTQTSISESTLIRLTQFVSAATDEDEHHQRFEVINACLRSGRSDVALLMQVEQVLDDYEHKHADRHISAFKLYFFEAKKADEVADALDIDVRTIFRDLAKVQAFLINQLRDADK